MLPLRQGDTGSDVGRVQQRLIESGAGIDHDELATSSFGSSTLAAIVAFQAAHGLARDGVVGPKTLGALLNPHTAPGMPWGFTAPGWRCAPSEARPELVQVLQWAVGMIGLQEQPPGSNRSPSIDRWAVAAGVPLGSPWCALFCSAAYQQMATGSPLGWLASAYKIKMWGEKHGLIVPVGAPLLPGDIWGILRADLHGHVGLIGGTPSDGKIMTVEANTGNACKGLIRQQASLSFVVRPIAV